MDANAPAQPVKARITQGQQVRWMEAAVAFMEEGESPAGIRAWLQEEGCPPRMRDELIRQAGAKLKGEHRKIGLRLAGLGALGTLGGTWFAMWGLSAHSGGVFKIGAAMLVAGVPPLFYGGWKLLSGSTVAAPPAR